MVEIARATDRVGCTQVRCRRDGKRLGREARIAQTSGECGAEVEHEFSSRAMATATRREFAQSAVAEHVGCQAAAVLEVSPRDSMGQVCG